MTAGQPTLEVWLGSPLRMQATIVQDVATFTVNRPDGAVSYRLDGAESRRTSTNPAGVTFTAGDLIVVSVSTPKTQRATMITRVLTYKKVDAGIAALTVHASPRHLS